MFLRGVRLKVIGGGYLYVELVGWKWEGWKGRG